MDASIPGENFTGAVLDGRYELAERLGSGSMGTVFKATQLTVGRVVAAKLLHGAMLERDDFRARFELEARAIGRLSHPNCITLFDFGYERELDVFYMIVEFLEGESLAVRIREPMERGEKIRTFYHVASALEHAHAHGILHRDLKPENVMIVPRKHRAPTSKVLDFGLARLLQGADVPEETPGRSQRITNVGKTFGTPAYMSPEQCLGEAELTPASDLYGLGVMMFEVFEGRLPFYSNKPSELMHQHLYKPAPSIENEDVPEPLRRLVSRLLEKSPSARVQSASDVLDVLHTFVQVDASGEFRRPSSDLLVELSEKGPKEDDEG